MPGQSRRPTTSTTTPAGGVSQNPSAGGYGNAATAAGLNTQEQPSFLQRLFGGGSSQAPAQAAAPAAWLAVTEGRTLLRRGARGEAVSHLQQLLVASGAQITVDGDFGPGTERAVRAFQQGAGLQVDGVVGRGTAGRLGGGTARPAPTTQDEARGARDAAVSGGSPDTTTRSSSSANGGPRLGVSANSFARAGLRPEVFSVAIDVFRNAWQAGQTQKTTYTVIDYSLPSTEKRLFVIDMERGRLLFHELVTHGSRSGGNQMTSHSNRNGSNQTSIGLSRTAETYYSQKFGGTALRIDGLEAGYNDNMRQRAVVMHQANYATPEAIAANGGARLGRSQGCPALDPRVAGEVIDTVKNGTLIFSYYPDPQYMRDSRYVNG